MLTSGARLKVLYIFDTSKCATNYRAFFEVYNGFIARSKDFEAMKAGMSAQPKSQFLFHKNLPPRAFSIMTLVENAINITMGTITCILHA